MGQAAVKQPPSNQEDAFRTDMSVGDILRRTREHYGQSLEDIERAIRIKSPQIKAIETGDVENLPGRVYAIGFVRSYSEYLGLDGDKMVRLFKAQSAGRAAKPHLDFPVGASESKMPPLWVLALSALLAVFISIGWWSGQGQDRTLVTEIPPVPEELQVALTNVNTSLEGVEEDLEFVAEEALAIEEELVETPAPLPEGIILNMLQNSWVEIKDANGKPLVSRVLKAGDQYFVPADRPDLTMSIGNAGGVQIQVNGELIDFLGERGQVRRNISLDAESLKSQYSLPENTKTIENTGE